MSPFFPGSVDFWQGGCQFLRSLSAEEPWTLAGHDYTGQKQAYPLYSKDLQLELSYCVLGLM